MHERSDLTTLGVTFPIPDDNADISQSIIMGVGKPS